MTGPAYMDYTALVSNIRTYSERPNDAALLAQIPQIVLLAESELASDLKTLGNELVVNAPLVIGNATLEKPLYWRTTVSMRITDPTDGAVMLYKRTVEFLRSFWPDAAAVGRPRYYAEYNANNFLIAPTPDFAYPLQLIYNARLDPLSAENTTNWFTTNAPQVLLYGCMYHTSLFLKNFDKAAEWKGHYATALMSLKGEDASRVTDRSTVEG
jgi:hypothetical protein